MVTWMARQTPFGARPNREAIRAARPMLPGRLQEMPGDRHPSEMIMTHNREQNSAYSPLLFSHAGQPIKTDILFSKLPLLS